MYDKGLLFVDALYIYAQCIYAWVQHHVGLVCAIACGCVWILYSTYRAWQQGHVIFAWERPVYIPRSYDALCQHFSMDFNNMCAVSKEMCYTFRILVCCASIVMSIIMVGPFVIGIIGVIAFVSLILCNPTFWIAIVVIKVLFFM